VTEADALPHGEQGAWLRRNALYAAQLSGWRKQHAERGLDGLQAQAPGRKGADPGRFVPYYNDRPHEGLALFTPADVFRRDGRGVAREVETVAGGA